MANTAATYPVTMASTKLASESNTWTSPTNIGADDAAYASITATTFDSPDLSYALVCTAFGFAIPAGATIDGIVVEVERYYANGAVSDYDIQLRYNAAALGSVQSSGTNWGAYPSSVGVVTIGSSSNKWGATLTADIVNHSTFGVAYHCQAGGTDSDAFVDYIRMTVYYTAATVYEYGTATLAGTGTVVAAAVKTVVSQAILSGTGTLTGIVNRIRNAITTLTGAGGLGGIVNRIRSGITVITGSGLISGIVNRIRGGVTTLSGVGTLTGVGIVTEGGKTTQVFYMSKRNRCKIQFRG